MSEVRGLSIDVICGQLIVGGFDGTSLSGTFAEALAKGLRGGAILFKRNLTSPAQAAALNADIAAASPDSLPPLVAVDQEGGRVARIGSPALRLPPMRAIGRLGDAAFTERLAERQGAELAAMGFTMNFAPILDVHTRPENPIIGDRAFASGAEQVAELGVAWARGLERGGVLACGKHFPGHGDTTTDSHLELPLVPHSKERLREVELVPFAAAARAGIAALMTAHVLYPELDAQWPATLSRIIATDMRSAIGFDGILVSDDLEMKALSTTLSIEESSVAAIAAGCDALLVCSDESLQERAHAALAARAARDAPFFARCAEAAARGLRARRRVRPRPVRDEASLTRVFEQSADVARELESRGGWS